MSKSAQKPQDSSTPRREHWSAASSVVQRKLSELKADGDAVGFVTHCFSVGFACHRDEIPQPATQAKDAGMPVFDVNRRFGSMKMQSEQQALSMWDSRAAWRSSTLAEEQAARQSAYDATERDKQVRRRAGEIVAQKRNELELAAIAQAKAELASS